MIAVWKSTVLQTPWATVVRQSSMKQTIEGIE